MPRMGGRVAIAATGPVSLAAGREVALAGGNAVDVAVAAAMAAMSTEPGIVSLAGGAFISVWPADGDPVVIDGNVEMPGRGLPADRFGGGVDEVSFGYGGGVTLFGGHGSVATPGSVTACELAVEELGTVSWADVVAPAARACRAGYPVGSPPRRTTSASPRTRSSAATPRRSRSSPARTAHRWSRATSAPTTCSPRSSTSWRDGASVLSTGEIGRAMVADMAAHGGLVTHRDFAEYTPLVRPPVRRAVGEWDLAVNPPPSVGGPMLAVMLGEMGRRGDWHWPDIIEIQRSVLAYRRSVHDVSRDLDAAGHELLLSVDRHGLAGLPTSASTANVSAVDSDGTACTITVSSGYGAGITVPGTGMLLNNALGEPELNRLGLHKMAPGIRLASNMAPTTGRTRDGRVLAIGSPGADRITTALMQVLGQGCLHGADLAHAIEAPRLHVSFDADGTPVVDHESDGAIADAVRGLGLRGTDHGRHQMFFGGVGAAFRHADGVVQAAGDPRREAAVEVASRA
jgi:gamma-glutamyltranspeptidase/glutathione hydrolase